MPEMPTEQQILRTELRWASVVAAVVGVIFAVIVVSSAVMIIHPPSNVELIDPATLHIEGEFVEANLGTTETSDGKVTARILASQFAFVPSCIAVPAGREVTFRLTSPDVIHGLIVSGTNVNTMVVPGYVSQVRATVRKPGTYLMPCHEYCGLGHSDMGAQVQAFAPQDWNPDENGKVSCEAAR